MKVIKKGEIPKEQIYKITCGNCSSLLEYVEADIKSSQTTATIFWVNCPECGQEISHYNLGRQQLNG